MHALAHGHLLPLERSLSFCVLSYSHLINIDMTHQKYCKAYKKVVKMNNSVLPALLPHLLM